MNTETVLEMKNIGKSFPGVRALDKVHFNLKKGSVHALLGENGAGKSTLMKILSGVYTADEGEIFVKGEKVAFTNTVQSQEKGISIIHQELNLCWNLSVAENILLAREITGALGFCKRSEMNESVGKVLNRLGVEHIRPEQLVEELSIANQQMVEISKAISIDADILIMDEPTSSLTDKEIAMLFKIIKRLQEHGVSIVYISHKLEEIFEICDEITVIRDGVWIDTLPIEKATKNSLIELMVGRSLEMIYPEASDTASDEVVFEVKNLRKHGLVDDISFQIKKGEILGISGLVGAGRTEMAKTIFGRWEKDGGNIFLNGEEIVINSPGDAIKHGIAFVTEDRKKEGLNLIGSVVENILSSNLDLVTGPGGFVNSKKERDIARKAVERLKVKTPTIDTPVKSLSGGNQQKLIISRWLAKDVSCSNP